MVQTGGFQTSAMPQIGLADPMQVALDPNKISTGVLQAYQLANAHYNLQETKAKILAQKKLQDELDALHDSRVEAAQAAYKANTSNANTQVATNTAEAPNIAPRAALVGSQIGAQQALVKPQTDVALGAAQATLGNQAFTESQRPAVEATQNINNISALTAAPTEALTTLEAAKGKYFASQLASAKALDELQSLPQDKARKDALIEAQTNEQNALADYHAAQGRLADARPSMQQQRDAAKAQLIDTHFKAYTTLQQDYQRANQALKDLRNTYVTDPQDSSQKITASQLNDKLAAANKGSAIWKLFTDPKVMSEDDRNVLSEIAATRDRVATLGKSLDSISTQIASHYNQDQTDQGNVKPPAGPTITTEDKQAVDWLLNPANQSNPNYQRILDATRKKGLIK